MENSQMTDQAQEQQSNTPKSPITNEIRKKCKTDLDKKHMINSWQFMQNGKELSDGDKGYMWYVLREEKDQNILVKVKDGSQNTFVLPEENIPAFKQWLRNKGVTVGNIIRDKCDTDVAKAEFILGLQRLLLEKDIVENGENIKKVLMPKDIADLWKELQRDKSLEILTKVNTEFGNIYVLPKEKIPALTKWLTEKGIVIDDVQDKYEIYTTRFMFAQSWRVERYGEVFGPYDKLFLWDMLKKDPNQNILIKLQVGPQISYVLPKEHIPAFKQWLNKRDVIVHDVRKKRKTDIGKEMFYLDWNLNSRGKYLSINDKCELWDELQKDENQKILIRVRSGCTIPFVLPKKNIPAFKQWLARKNITIAEKREFEREKVETDLRKDYFTRKWKLEKAFVQNGKNVAQALNTQDKEALWNELLADEKQNILVKVLAKSIVAYVLPEENIPALKQWLAQRDTYVVDFREKRETDLIRGKFVDSWRLKQNGKTVTKQDKFVLWDELQEAVGQNILIKVNSGSSRPHVLPEENIPLFKQWLKEKGIDAFTPLDVLNELQEKANQAATPEEKNKYKTQAKKMFKTLKQNVSKKKSLTKAKKTDHGKA